MTIQRPKYVNALLSGIGNGLVKIGYTERGSAEIYGYEKEMI